MEGHRLSLCALVDMHTRRANRDLFGDLRMECRHPGAVASRLQPRGPPVAGCMNNFTFGDEAFGYYETIAGGAGAGPSWHGKSGVQT